MLHPTRDHPSIPGAVWCDLYLCLFTKGSQVADWVRLAEAQPRVIGLGEYPSFLPGAGMAAEKNHHG